MFKIISNKGRLTPRFFCDACGEQIVDAKNAIVIYHSDRGIDGEEVKHSLAHKGTCDRKITASVGDDGGTDEMAPFMAYVLANLGMDERGVKDAFDVARMLNSL